MRIFLIGASELDVRDSMEKHIYEVLNDMGHSVGHVNMRRIPGVPPRLERLSQFIARNALREPERLAEKNLLRQISKFQPNLIIVILGSMLSPKTVASIRSTYKKKIVCWCQDQLTTLGRQYLIGCDYDAVFVKDHYLVDMFRRYIGMNVHYLPEACNPTYHRSVSLTAEEYERYRCEIVTYGTLYYYRQKILEPLKGYDLRIYGNCPDWLLATMQPFHMNMGIYELEKCKALTGAVISLNSFHFGEIYGLNARAFEIAGCGGFQLASHTSAVKDHFVIGEEIETFSSRDELLEKVDFYLENPDKAKAIADAGNKRAHLDHTYEKRLSALLELSEAQ